MKSAPFEYHAPERAAEVVDVLAELGDDAKVLAGGQSLIPMLAMRLAVFEHLVDVRRVSELTGIERRDDALWIGAGTTEAALERSRDVAADVPLLALATPLIGHLQIRNRGTIGGCLAHADPAAEYPAVALALDATIETLSPRGRRDIPATAFFTGLWETALAPDEVLTGVSFPVWRDRAGFAVEELARRHGDFAIAGAAIGVELDGDDRITRAALGLLGMGNTPQRAVTTEAEIVGRPVGEVDPEELGQLAVSSLPSIPADLHGSSAYRKRVGAAMVSRAWTRAVGSVRDELHVARTDGR